MGSSLTPIQRKILTFIEEQMAAQGAPPSLRDIAAHFRFKAVGTVQGHIKALLQKGYLQKDAGKARGLRLASTHWSGALNVPILGAIAAGHPREALEVTLGAIPVPPGLSRKGNLFALRVTGDSMVDAGIFEGDLVIARQQSTANPGDIVVALVEGAATVKRLDRRGGALFLVPENPRYKPIEIKTENASIQGKVISIQRYLEKTI